MRPRLVGLALSVLWLISVCARAQDSSSLTGTITDQSGAVITSAEVTVMASERGLKRSTTTNSNGEYLISGLPPGSYGVTIRAPGFGNYQANNLVLRVAQKARADVTLHIGTAKAEITVSGEEIAQIESQSSELAGTITGRQIAQLQLNGRDFTQLVTLVPGVSNQNTEDQENIFLGYSFNGGRVEYNNWELDGGDILDNGSNQTLNVAPSIDAISEVRVLTCNYGAQYGRNGSGTIEIETKSGTRDFHGDVYEFLRNDFFNARNYFDPPGAAPTYKKHDFGYTLGGPLYIPGRYNIKRDKTFFFWSQEWRHDRIPGDLFFGLLPSPAEREGNFADLCPNALTNSFDDCPIDPTTGGRFINDQVPVAFNAQFLLGMIPLPNGGQPGAETFSTVPIIPTDRRQDSIRIDQNFNTKLRGMTRFTHDTWKQVVPSEFGGGSPAGGRIIRVPGLSLVARLTANLSDVSLNEFVFSYTTDHYSESNHGRWQLPPEATYGSLFPNGFGGKLPGFNVNGSAAYGGGFGAFLGFAPWTNSNPTYTYRDTVTRIIGRHNLHVGAYAVAAQKNEPNAPNVQGVFTFNTASNISTGNPFADLLTGRIRDFSQTNRKVRYYNRYKILEPYFQDDWRVNSRLTLNLGLRISLFGTYRDKSKQAYNFDRSFYNKHLAPSIDPDTGALVFQQGTDVNTITGMVRCGVGKLPAGCMTGHLFNPAPRFGFAYDPSGKAKISIRGGYGIFFEHTNGNEANTESLAGSPSLVLSADQLNVSGYENIGHNTTQGGGPVLFPIFALSIPNHAVWPYVQQWHLDVQRELPVKAVLTVAYIGTQGTHLTLQRDLNQIPALPLSLNPYKPGEPIGGVDRQHDDCNPDNMTTPSGVVVRGQAALHLAIACGADPNPSRPFTGYSVIDRVEQTASSTYQALQALLRRDIGGLQFSVAYTYSHSFDNSSDRFDNNFVDSYDLRSNRASSNYDQRHILNISYVYDVPTLKESGIISKLTSDWQLSGITTFQTGTPFSVVNAATFFDNAGVANGVGTGTYADVIGNPYSSPPMRMISGLPGPLIFDPAAFAAPRGLTFGNSGRNFLRNPQRTNFDIALFKQFSITEAKKFEFRGEVFNIFNHTQWVGVNGAMTCYGGVRNSADDTNCITQNTFMHPVAAHRSRILQLGLKFLF